MDYRKVRELRCVFSRNERWGVQKVCVHLSRGGRMSLWALCTSRVKIILGYVYMCVSGEWYLCKRETGVFVLLS